MKRKLVTLAALAAAILAAQAAMAMGIEQTAPAASSTSAAEGGNTANDRPASVDEDKPQPSPRSSSNMRNSGTGTVSVMVQVGADGKPKSFHVIMSSGSKSLDDEAVRTVKAWSYKPAIKTGAPADGYVQIPVVFNK